MPLLQQICYLDLVIKEYDRLVRKLCKKYPATKILQQITGVGELTSLAFVLIVGDPHRFDNAARLCAYLGVVPKQDQSGDTDKQLGITKKGNKLGRKLLIQAAHYILDYVVNRFVLYYANVKKGYRENGECIRTT